MIIAIDTGGTKTLIESFDEAGNKTFIEKFPTPPETDAYIAQVAAAVPETTPISAIVLAVPGIVESGVIAHMGNLPWRNFNVQRALEAHFPSTPIHVENDANLGGLGEVRMRPSTPSRCLYLTVSTGIGGGFIVDHHIDPTLATTEFGHMRLAYNGRLQRWEHFASGKAIKEEWGKLASEITSEDEWRAVAERVSRGLLVLLPTLRPEVVIMGGGVGAHFEKFSQYLQEILAQNLEPIYVCPVVGAEHPEEAVIYGCYYYALDHTAR